jgi:hypothetical protein
MNVYAMIAIVCTVVGLVKAIGWFFTGAIFIILAVLVQLSREGRL